MSKDKLTDEDVALIRETISRLSMYIQGKKIAAGVMTDQATGGFNLACDFISDDLKKLSEFANSDFLGIGLKS